MFSSPFQQNPLNQFHTLLEVGAPAGYPNLQFANPHPYELSYASLLRPPARQMSRYETGHNMRLRPPTRQRLRR